MKLNNLHNMEFFVNTDAVDIRNKQIGIHYHATVNRVLCAGVNHAGTKETVKRATDVARLFAKSPELLKAAKKILAWKDASGRGTLKGIETIIEVELRELIETIEGKR